MIENPPEPASLEELLAAAKALATGREVATMFDDVVVSNGKRLVLAVRCWSWSPQRSSRQWSLITPTDCGTMSNDAEWPEVCDALRRLAVPQRTVHNGTFERETPIATTDDDGNPGCIITRVRAPDDPEAKPGHVELNIFPGHFDAMRIHLTRAQLRQHVGACKAAWRVLGGIQPAHTHNALCSSSRCYPAGEQNLSGWDKLRGTIETMTAEELAICGLRRIEDGAP